MTPRPPIPTLFPYTTLFRSAPAPPASPVLLVQFEVDGEVEDEVDGLAVERTRLESPLLDCGRGGLIEAERQRLDRKSTRLNSSHGYISYAVFCLKKKKRTPV